jgi:hypothetical protein
MFSQHTVASIKNIMSSYRIGTVERVDFTPINKKPGFGENVDEVVMSAFVHFSDPLLGGDNCYNYMSDSYLGHNDFWDDIACNQPYRLQISRDEYWICLNNKKPVQYTMMNIHQVVENSRHLENLVEEQKNKIQKLEEKINNMDQVIYQFVGGLFCQRTQEGVLENYLRVLDGQGFSLKPLPEDTHKWTQWPTTRQGDECEKRISALEDYMRDITRFENPRHAAVTPNFVNIHYNSVDDDEYDYDNESQDNDLQIRKNFRDNDTISSHSSMPSLIECSALHDDGDDDDNESISTHSSMPGLVDIDSVSSDERIRNSYELCGNN